MNNTVTLTIIFNTVKIWLFVFKQDHFGFSWKAVWRDEEESWGPSWQTMEMLGEQDDWELHQVCE